jgi:hypothetical protein
LFIDWQIDPKMQVLKRTLALTHTLLLWSLIGQAQALDDGETRAMLVDDDDAAAESDASHIRRQRITLVSYGRDPHPSYFPLGLCEGDCDQDSDVRSEISSVQSWDHANGSLIFFVNVSVRTWTSLLSTWIIVLQLVVFSTPSRDLALDPCQLLKCRLESKLSGTVRQKGVTESPNFHCYV